MKLSKEMVEAMGGVHSEHYQQFRKLCYTTFLHLRRYSIVSSRVREKNLSSLIHNQSIIHCRSFLIYFRHANLILNLFALMVSL